jgi:hypothetical protein
MRFIHSLLLSAICEVAEAARTESKLQFNGLGGLRTHISSIRIRGFRWHRATSHETIMSG